MRILKCNFNPATDACPQIPMTSINTNEKYGQTGCDRYQLENIFFVFYRTDLLSLCQQTACCGTAMLLIIKVIIKFSVSLSTEPRDLSYFKECIMDGFYIKSIGSVDT